MFGGNDPEVLVAGAGPVGLFAALDLARRGIRVAVVDTGVWPCTHSYALALHPQSLRLLQELGLRERVREGALALPRITIWDAKSQRTEIRLPGEPLLVLSQDTLERLLETALLEAGVRVLWRHELSALAPDAHGVLVNIDQYEKDSRGYVVARTEWVVGKSTALEVPFVLGADGYNSRVRRALQLDYPEVAPAQYYAVFEFKSDAALPAEMRIVLGEGTTDVLWPLPGGWYRWSFELPGYSDPETEQPQALQEAGLGQFPTLRRKERSLVSEGGGSGALKDEALRAALAKRAPWFKGTVEAFRWRTFVRFERRLAAGFGQGRMWLAGDAAHLTGPAGVQSMNLGFAEAHDLAGMFANVLRCGESPDSLAAYNLKWTGAWKQLHGIEGDLRPGPGADHWIASHAGRLLSCLPAHGAELAAMAAQLKLAF